MAPRPSRLRRSSRRLRRLDPSAPRSLRLRRSAASQRLKPTLLLPSGAATACYVCELCFCIRCAFVCMKKMTRMTSVLMLVMLGVVIQSSQALKCYDCEPCDADQSTWAERTCSSGQVCAKGQESGGAFATFICRINDCLFHKFTTLQKLQICSLHILNIPVHEGCG